MRQFREILLSEPEFTGLCERDSKVPLKIIPFLIENIPLKKLPVRSRAIHCASYIQQLRINLQMHNDTLSIRNGITLTLSKGM